jgi:hypothetical protein
LPQEKVIRSAGLSELNFRPGKLCRNQTQAVASGMWDCARRQPGKGRERKIPHDPEQEDCHAYRAYQDGRQKQPRQTPTPNFVEAVGSEPVDQEGKHRDRQGIQRQRRPQVSVKKLMNGS